ncbi:MAG: hypothetical protein WC731_03885 [Candidatus Omnitrophota bacterium]|jgi:hypothetical protein
MGKLKEILQIQDWKQKLNKLRNYAYKEGLSSPDIVEGESQLIKKITDFERHETNIMLTKISVAVASALLIWGIIYTFFVSPPKYTLDGTTLYFGKWFGCWVQQERKKNTEVNIYQRSVEFELHFILRNKNRGEGEVSKPILIITAKDSKKEFRVEPETQYTGIRTIKVGSYGIVDDFIEYFVRNYDEAQKELLGFLQENRNKLEFKIKGEPYGEIKVKFLENYRN